MTNIAATRCIVTGPLETITRFRVECIRQHSIDDPAVMGLDFEVVLPSPECLHEPPWNYDSRVSDGLAVLGVTLPVSPETGFAAAMQRIHPAVETLEGMMEFPWVRKAGITTTAALRRRLLERDPDCVALAEAAIAKVRASGYRYLGDWRVDHWDVRSNASGYEETADTPFGFRFGTPWSFPEQVFQALAARYPALSFDCACIEQGQGFGAEGVFNPRAGQSPFSLCDPDDRLYTLVFGVPPDELEEDEDDEVEESVSKGDRRGMVGDFPVAGGETLGERLHSYPPFTPLHLGSKLSKAQAEANFAQLVAAIPERLKIAIAFLQQEQVDPRSALAQQDPRPFLTALWDWGRLRWKTAPQPRHVMSAWRESRRDGEDILLSLLCDIGLILGEIIHGFRPDYHWAMVDDREERKRNMSHYRQPVLKIDAPRPDCTPSYQLFDILEVAARSYIGTQEPWAPYRNEMARVVSTCVLGGYELGWQGYSVIPPMQSWDNFLVIRAAGTP